MAIQDAYIARVTLALEALTKAQIAEYLLMRDLDVLSLAECNHNQLSHSAGNIADDLDIIFGGEAGA